MLRKLQERQRYDVIQSLKLHDIGYHTEYHCVHPLVAEYERGKSMEEGALEFEKREGKGIRDIRSTFGVNSSCYGQPGDSWSPQVYLTLRHLDIGVYLDETRFIGLDGAPFWHCGILNFVPLDPPRGEITGVNFRLVTRAFLDEAKKAFDEAHQQINKQGSWGIISIFNHLHTLVTQESWDEINFARESNLPLDRLRKPRLKSGGWVEAGYRNFDEFVSYMKSKENVVFFTASDLSKIFVDRAKFKSFSVKGLASGLKPELLTWRKIEGRFMSVSQQFWLVIHALASCLEGGGLLAKVKDGCLQKPFNGFHSEALPEVGIEAFL